MQSKFQKGEFVYFMGEKAKIVSVEGVQGDKGREAVYYIVERKHSRFDMPEKEALLSDTLLAVSEFNLRR